MEDVIIWEWFDKKAWVAYDSATNQILEQAFHSGQLTLILDHGFFSGGPYTVDFKTMRQTNDRTSFTREMRRNPGMLTQPLAYWACLVKKKYVPYDAETCKILEDGYQSGVPKLTLEHGIYKDSPYVIDFVEMKQMNKQTGYVREIRRIVGQKNMLIKEKDKPPKPNKSKDEDLESSRNRRNSLMPRVQNPIAKIAPEKLKPCYGDIMINLKGGRDIAEVSPLGIDPFVVITTDFSAFVAKTEWKFKTTAPAWNQRFILPVSRYDMEGKVLLTVYNFNHLKKNNYLGRLDLSLYEIVSKVDVQGWMPLSYEARKKSKKQPAGQLEIALHWDSKPLPQASKLDLSHILQNNSMVAQRQQARAASITQNDQQQPLSSSVAMFRGLSVVTVPKQDSGVTTTGATPTAPSTAPLPVSGGGPVQTNNNMNNNNNTWVPPKEIVEFADPNVVEGVLGRYQLGEMLGEGGFAVVKKATNLQTKERVAIKIIQKMIQADADAIALITREIQILHLVENQSCVSFVESRETSENIYIVMEYVGGGDLLDAILDAGGFDEPRSAKSIHDILRGLEYLHHTGICHRDMKPENVLYHPEHNVWKIADFGCATLFTETVPFMTDFEGTIQYMAPEILVGEKYTKSIDIWATGVITYVSLSACFPWEGKTDAEVQESIMTYKIKFYSPEFDNVSPDAIGFILRLLEMNTEKRITLEAALSHPWMKNQLGGGVGAGQK